jgi:hypothetical protein
MEDQVCGYTVGHLGGLSLLFSKRRQVSKRKIKPVAAAIRHFRTDSDEPKFLGAVILFA